MKPTCHRLPKFPLWREKRKKHYAGGLLATFSLEPCPGLSADFAAVNQSVSQSMLLNDFLVSMRRDMHVLDVRKMLD